MDAMPWLTAPKRTVQVCQSIARRLSAADEDDELVARCMHGNAVRWLLQHRAALRVDKLCTMRL